MAALGVAGLCLVAALPAATGKKDANPASRALFEKAIQASGIESSGAGAFRLQATAQISNPDGRTANALLVEFWAPGNRLRQESLLANFNQTDVSDGRNWWTKSTVSYTPYPLALAWQALAFVSELRSTLQPDLRPEWSRSGPAVSQTLRMVGGPPSPTPLKLGPSSSRESKPAKTKALKLGKPKREKGADGKCVEVQGNPRPKMQFCFDPSTGHLTRIRNERFGLRYEYGNYQPFGGKSFPRDIRIFGDKKTVILAIHVTAILPLKNSDPKLFLPPAGSKRSAACSQMNAPRLIKATLPAYPTMAQRNRIDGLVLLHALIGKDGAPHALWPIRSPLPLLTAAAAQAVQQWRFSPATCKAGGQKRDINTFIAIKFALP